MPKYLKDIFSIIAGASGAHAITLLASLFLTRIYTPEMFGILGLVIAVASFASPMMNLGYQWAIVLPPLNKHSKDILWLSHFISLINCLILYILFIFLFDIFVIFFEESALFIVLFAPIIAFSQSYLNSTKQYLGKVNAFFKVAYLTFFLALLTNLLKISLGIIVDPSAIILNISVVLSYVILTVFSLFLIPHPGFKRSLVSIYKSYVIYFRKHKELAKFRLPQEFFNSASQVVPVILIGIFYSPAIVGFYTLARTITVAPVNLIGGALGVIISPKLAQIKNSREGLTPFLQKSTLYFVLSGLPIYAILFFFGEEIFSLAFGSNWAQAGRLSEWLSIWFFSMYITSSVNRISPMIKYYADDLIFSFVKLFVRTSTII